MKEIWKDIPEYEGLYQVSDLGRVKSLMRFNSRGFLVKERILKQAISSNKYLLVSLFKNGKKKTPTTHQLVAIAFLNHTSDGYKTVVNHKNFIRTDNRVDNLELVSARENTNRKHLKSASKYTGVYWYKAYNKWKSTIVIKGFKKHLGYFENEHDAHLAYQNELKLINNNFNI